MVSQVGLSSVDKQAMVEDWLNPEPGEVPGPGPGETREMIAPQVNINNFSQEGQLKSLLLRGVY